MKNTKVTLIPLTDDDREQFILDNQWSFKHGALYEFGERDNHIDFDGEIISRRTIERCIDAPDSEAYRIVVDGKKLAELYSKSTKKHITTSLKFSLFLPTSIPKELAMALGLRLKRCTPKQRFGKPALLILKSETFIST